MYNFSRIEQAFTTGLLAYDGKFSYSKGSEAFTGISSYQLNCKRYYAANATGKRITSKFIVNHYRLRWGIEVLFRDLKQLCHLQDCQSKRTQAQKHYVYMYICAFKVFSSFKALMKNHFIRIKKLSNKKI